MKKAEKKAEEMKIIELSQDTEVLPEDLRPWAGEIKFARQLTNGDFSVESQGSQLSRTFTISHVIPSGAATVIM